MHHNIYTGWLSYRAGTPLHPSMREACVSSNLYTRAARCLAVQQQQQGGSGTGGTGRLAPILFLVVSSTGEDHGGATLTLDYRLV